MMRVETQNQKLAGVAARWREHYRGNHHGADKRAIGDRLAAIPIGELTAERINQTIGNSSWTKLTCDECAQDVKAVAVFDYDYERCFQLCKRCLERGIWHLDRTAASA